MTETGWEKRTADLRQQLASIKSRANKDSKRFQELSKQAEYLKIRFLAHQLEARRKFLARSRGAASAVKNKKGLATALGAAAGASIIVGIITKDRTAAMTAGMIGSKAALQGLGETDWAICLGKHLAVAPKDNTTPGDFWVTWDSLQAALDELEERTINGAPLGNLDNIISVLKKTKKLIIIIKAPPGKASKQP
jgi:hypothetical protein